MLVVDDLLAHVDGRAVELERLLDRLHGAVDARAVAARRREQDPLRRGESRGFGSGRHRAKGYRRPRPGLVRRGTRERIAGSAARAGAPTAPRLPAHTCDRSSRACATRRPARARARSRSRSGPPPAPRPRRTACGRRGCPAASPPNGCLEPDCCASQPRPRRGRTDPVGVRLARDVQIAVADHVEEHHRPDLAERRAALPAPTARVARRTGRSPGRRRSRERGAARRLLGVEQDEVDRGPFEARRQVPRQLQHDGHAGGPVVGADEPRDVLGVVVSADDDRAGQPARDPGDDVPVWALDRDVANAGRTQPLDDEPAPRARRPPTPTGRGPIATWVAQVPEGALGVEPGGGGRRSQRARRHLTAARAARGREAGRCRDGRQQKDIASGTWPYGRLG